MASVSPVNVGDILVPPAMRVEELAGALPVFARGVEPVPAGVFAGGITLEIGEAVRGRLAGIAADLIDLQLAFNLTVAADRAGLTVAGLLGRLDTLVAFVALGVNPVFIPEVQEEANEILEEIEGLARNAAFAGTPLLQGGRLPAGAEAPRLPEARIALLGAAAGGPALATVGTGGVNALAVNPAGAATVVAAARGEIAAGRAELAQAGNAALPAAIDQDQAELANLAAVDRAVLNRVSSTDAMAQLLGQGLMGASLLATFQNRISRQRLTDLMAT